MPCRCALANRCVDSDMPSCRSASGMLECFVPLPERRGVAGSLFLLYTSPCSPRRVVPGQPLWCPRGKLLRRMPPPYPLGKFEKLRNFSTSQLLKRHLPSLGLRKFSISQFRKVRPRCGDRSCSPSPVGISVAPRRFRHVVYAVMTMSYAVLSFAVFAMLCSSESLCWCC